MFINELFIHLFFTFWSYQMAAVFFFFFFEKEINYVFRGRKTIE